MKREYIVPETFVAATVMQSFLVDMSNNPMSNNDAFAPRIDDDDDEFDKAATESYHLNLWGDD